MPRSLYIIDGHSQIFRAYYAPFRTLTSPTGEPTRATYVFCQMLLNLIRDRRPDYLVMVLDAERALAPRRAIYPEYKATRQQAPEDLGPQERRIISILETANVPILQLPGWEADDVIATLVKHFAGAPAPAITSQPSATQPPAPPAVAEPELEVYLVSRDKDLDQLLRPAVAMYDPMKEELITAERLPDLKGWTPAQAVDAQALTGDSSDNVPGVPGIGPKTAAKLLQQYGSLENILAHVDELKPAQRDALRAHAAQLQVNRELVRLRDDVPVEFDLHAAECSRFAWQRVRPIFEELGFRRMVDQLPRNPEETRSAAAAPSVVAPVSKPAPHVAEPRTQPPAFEPPPQPKPRAGEQQSLFGAGRPSGGDASTVTVPPTAAEDAGAGGPPRRAR
ncbi:MAG: 5'-3' exonuclease H3TH domain-containing protein, partial [Planctomycetota bacterium]